MQVSPQDRQERFSGRPNPSLVVLAVAILIIAGAVYLIYSYTQEQEEQVMETQEVPQAEQMPELPPAPDIPKVDVVQKPEEPPFILPTLEASDVAVRERLDTLSKAEPVALWLTKDNLIQRTATLIDGFSRGVVLKKLLPFDAPAGNFKVEKTGDQLVIDKSAYTRYNTYTNMFVNLDSEVLAENFHLFRPLLEEAYGELGKQPGEVDNALIRAIDLMLATPEPREPITLVRESVYYKFADPDLERLPAIQKQLLRVGPDNRRKIKDKLEAVRRELINEAGAANPMQDPG